MQDWKMDMTNRKISFKPISIKWESPNPLRPYLAAINMTIPSVPALQNNPAHPQPLLCRPLPPPRGMTVQSASNSHYEIIGNISQNKLSAYRINLKKLSVSSSSFYLCTIPNRKELQDIKSALFELFKELKSLRKN